MKPAFERDRSWQASFVRMVDPRIAEGMAPLDGSHLWLKVYVRHRRGVAGVPTAYVGERCALCARPKRLWRRKRCPENPVPYVVRRGIVRVP